MRAYEWFLVLILVAAVGCINYLYGQSDVKKWQQQYDFSQSELKLLHERYRGEVAVNEAMEAELKSIRDRLIATQVELETCTQAKTPKCKRHPDEHVRRFDKE
jgi:hypothetical protein